MATLTEIVHQFLSFPMWVFLGLLAVAIWCCRAPERSRAFRLRYWAMLGAGLFYLLSLPAIPAVLEVWLESRYPVRQVTEADSSPDNVIIVLTAGWLRYTRDGYEQKLGEAGWERTVAAVALRKRIGGRILFSGAPTPDGKGSAAGTMAEFAKLLGVPADALLVEPAALNTHENLLFSKRLLGPGVHRVWLLTSAFHLPRAVAAAQGEGMEVIPFPCDFRADEGLDWTAFLPGNAARPALERSLHELVGMAAYRWRGWI